MKPNPHETKKCLPIPKDTSAPTGSVVIGLVSVSESVDDTIRLVAKPVYNCK